MSVFKSYQDWRRTMIEHAGLTLDQDYCKERLTVLENETFEETQTFIELYGASYHQQVISWFNKALSEA